MNKTHYCKITDLEKQKDCIIRAASIIKWGGTVAFPTETVYGLGANALNPKAVEKIFKAKGRPADNPLIAHIARFEDLAYLTAEIPAQAEALISAFWPGPLTLVLKKSEKIPTIVTAGLDSIGIRMPANPIALAIIKKAKVPVAAPSANLSGKPSPTQGRDVLRDLAGKIDMVVDGGPSLVGLESTVLDLTVDPPMILRPGGISKEDLELFLNKVVLDPGLLLEQEEKDLKPRSPGMKYSHYSPQAEIHVVYGLKRGNLSKLNKLIEKEKSKGKKVGLFLTEETAANYLPPVDNPLALPDFLKILGSIEEPEVIAHRLYNSFREADRNYLDLVFAEDIPQEGLGLAIMNRLIKAAGHRIIRV